MTNLVIRKVPVPLPSMAERIWDPLRAIRALLVRDPLAAVVRAGQPSELELSPAFDVMETRDSYELKADVPGIKEADLEVSVTGQDLAVSGIRETETEEDGDHYWTYERSSGAFTRTFSVPGADAEHVRASLDRGVLSIRVPKKPEAQTRKIAVNAEVFK
jgi:HSP20 family protein